MDVLVKRGMILRNGVEWEVFSFIEGNLAAPSVCHRLHEQGVIELRGNSNVPIVINRIDMMILRRSLVEAMLRYAKGENAVYAFSTFQIQLNHLAEVVVIFNPATKLDGPLTEFKGINNIELLMYSLLQI